MGCTDRTITCHSNCEKYKNWRKEYLRLKKENQNIMGCYMVEQKIKREKANKWKR
jgi:hypothetical protein